MKQRWKIYFYLLKLFKCDDNKELNLPVNEFWMEDFRIQDDILWRKKFFSNMFKKKQRNVNEIFNFQSHCKMMTMRL